MSEFDEQKQNETIQDEIAAVETAEVAVDAAEDAVSPAADEAAVEQVSAPVAPEASAEDAADQAEAPAEAVEAAEAPEAAAEGIDHADLDDQLFDKAQRAARLLRNRKAALAAEAEAETERLNTLIRALKLLELKPKMEEKEMADLLGMRLRELDRLLSQAEKQDLVARVEPEDGDMRAIVVYASEDAIELAKAQGKKRKKLIPTLSAETAEQAIAVLDQLIEPLVAMGLDEDRGPRGGRDERGGRGGRDDRGGRGGRGGFGGRDRGGFRS